jgi:hypothetical protein
MFSLVKWLQGIGAWMKARKGIWFTLLTLLSASGIVVSMYFINTMTDSTAKKIYLQEAQEYNKFYDFVVSSRYNTLLSVANTVAEHRELKVALKENNFVITNAVINKLTTRLNKNSQLGTYTLEAFAKGSKTYLLKEGVKLAISQKLESTGIEVDAQATYLKAIVPIVTLKGEVVGAVEVKQTIHSLKNEFKAYDRAFAFIMKNSYKDRLDMRARKGKFKKINEEYSVILHEYLNQFYTNISTHDFKEMFDRKYALDTNYYTTFSKVYDMQGNEIGIAFFGEEVEHAGGFVKQTQNLINSVTTVALGLVVSLILFMF